MSLSTYRALFPVTEKSVYLNNAAESPLNTRVRQKLEGYLKLAAEEPQNKPEVRTIVRKQLSEIFGGTVDDYALVTSTGIGIGIVASGYQWLEEYNTIRPHGSLGGMNPEQFLQRWTDGNINQQPKIITA